MGATVTCAVCPSVNTLRAQLIFPSKPKLCNLFKLWATKSIQYLPHLRCEECEINSSNSPKAFQQHQECPQIPIQISVSILFKFLEKMVW
jgi:hypothetical protein